MKTCTVCLVEKLLDEFPKQTGKRYKSTHKAMCKKCTRNKRVEYYQNNKERELINNQKWMTANKRWTNPKWRNYHNAWRRAADRTIEHNNRRCREIGAEGSFTLEEWYELCDKFDNKCLSCKRLDVKLTQDHVVPLVSGGSNWITNIQPLCGPCNSSKGAKTIDFREGDDNDKDCTGG